MCCNPDPKVMVSVTGFFVPLVPAVLGQAASKNEDVDQTRAGGKAECMG